MDITIGTKIKELRKQKGITQEKLAENIGISFQAISKWENNIALPDITLVPSLANFFGVTIDELFNYDLKEMKNKVKTICDEAYQYRENQPAKAKKILEDGLKLYPKNELILNNLLYVINYSKNPDDTIDIASKLIEETNDVEIKYDALRFLAYAYDAKGEYDSAKNAIEQIPELYFSKLSEAAFVLRGEDKYNAAQKEKYISFEILLQMCQKLSEYYQENDAIEKSILEIQFALEIITAIKDDETRAKYDDYKVFFEKRLECLKNR